MQTSFPSTRRWFCWASLAAALTLSGCQQQPLASAEPIPPELAARLAAEPAACDRYRDQYVLAFQQHVSALSRDDQVAAERARDQLRRLRRELQEQGMGVEACSRPRCIIEPLQGGKLDSWCGFRLADQTGARLYRWVAWPPTEARPRTEELP